MLWSLVDNFLIQVYGIIKRTFYLFYLATIKQYFILIDDLLNYENFNSEGEKFHFLCDF